MKLSEAIEKALTDRMYSLTGCMWGQSSYMCVVLKAWGRRDLAKSVEDMVQGISPNPYRGQALVSALYETGYITDSMSRAEQFAYTTELYVWWVFDLKRKGL